MNLKDRLSHLSFQEARKLLGAPEPAPAGISAAEGASTDKGNAAGRMNADYQKLLEECLEKREDGSLQLTVSFPDESILDTLASVLGRFRRSGHGLGG